MIATAEPSPSGVALSLGIGQLAWAGGPLDRGWLRPGGSRDVLGWWAASRLTVALCMLVSLAADAAGVARAGTRRAPGCDAGAGGGGAGRARTGAVPSTGAGSGAAGGLLKAGAVLDEMGPVVPRGAPTHATSLVLAATRAGTRRGPATADLAATKMDVGRKRAGREDCSVRGRPGGSLASMNQKCLTS